MRNDGVMVPITPRHADHVDVIGELPVSGRVRLVDPLCDNLPALAGWMALPVGLSVFLWGCLLTAVFT